MHSVQLDMIWAFHCRTDSLEDMHECVLYTPTNRFMEQLSLILIFFHIYCLFHQCAKVTMPELTLARFILEFSLMSYELVTLSDSKIAAASLFMALRMNNKTGWNKTLQYFSGNESEH